MRKALTSFVAVAAVLMLAACSDPAPKASPKTFQPEAQQSAVMPDDAPPQEEPTAPAGPDEATDDGEPAACASEMGAAASARLVARCIAVSPATRPPCNAANPCDLIQGEIDRSCAMYGPGEARPPECAG